MLLVCISGVLFYKLRILPTIYFNLWNKKPYDKSCLLQIVYLIII